jgi:hypothetical protein
MQLGEETEAFASSLKLASEDASHVKNTTGGHLAQRLHEDDRKFDALQKLMLPCGGGIDPGIDSNQKASRLVRKLVDFTCEEIRCRLDRIYLERLREPISHENGIGDVLSMQAVSLKGDLETLYAEIRDVVAMSVSQEFEHPLLNSQRESSQRHKASEDLAHQSVSQPDHCSTLRPDDRRYSPHWHSLDSYLKMLPTVLSHSIRTVHHLMSFRQSIKGLVLLLTWLQRMVFYSPRLPKNHLWVELHWDLCSVILAFRTRL